MSKKDEKSIFAYWVRIIACMTTVAVVLVSVVVFIARASDGADTAIKKTEVLEAALIKLANSQIELKSTANQNKNKSENNSKLIKTLSEAQIEQKVDIKYIKAGITKILNGGG